MKINPSQIPLRPTVDPDGQDKKIREVASLYEKQFLRELMKSMRSTVSYSDMSKPSGAEQLYRDNLDNEYVEAWGERGGIGLSDIIYTQLKERYFPSARPGAHDDKGIEVLKKGMFPVRPNSGTEGIQIEQVPSAQPQSMNFKVKAPGLADVVAPLPGVVTESYTHPEWGHVLHLSHTNQEVPLQSKIIFKGILESPEIGEPFEAGQKFGLLKKSDDPVFWSVSPSEKALSKV